MTTPTTYQVLEKEHAVYPGHALMVAYVIMHVYDSPQEALAYTRGHKGWPDCVGSMDVPGAGCGANAGAELVHRLYRLGAGIEETVEWADENWKRRVGPGTGNHEEKLVPGLEQAERFKERFIAKAKTWVV